MSIKRLNRFFQTADIDRNVVSRDPDSGKPVLSLYYVHYMNCFGDTLC